MEQSFFCKNFWKILQFELTHFENTISDVSPHIQIKAKIKMKWYLNLVKQTFPFSASNKQNQLVVHRIYLTVYEFILYQHLLSLSIS